jgi:alpha-ketoglutarate-dependent taurine dioxygenase
MITRSDTDKPSITTAFAKRRAFQLSVDRLVDVRPLIAEQPLPLSIAAKVPGLSLLSWATARQAFIQEALLQSGGLLFRNFQVDDVAEVEQFLQTLAGELLNYHDRSSPRSSVYGRLYTSTDHPADQSIFLHSENSYAAIWPLKICFFCVQPASEGGETPIADTRRLFAQLDPAVRSRFAEKGILYVRNFGDGFGLPWQSVFQTDDPKQVEQYCQHHGIDWEWKSGDRLRTRQIGQAVAQHPQTREWVWFNHAVFFHVSTLEPILQAAILQEFAEADYPHHTYYGDGSPIESSVLEALRAIYQQETVTFPWQSGDVLLLDNMLTAHGRRPFTGLRRVVVGMAEPINRNSLNPSA